MSVIKDGSGKDVVVSIVPAEPGTFIKSSDGSNSVRVVAWRFLTYPDKDYGAATYCTPLLVTEYTIGPACLWGENDCNFVFPDGHAEKAC